MVSGGSGGTALGASPGNGTTSRDQWPGGVVGGMVPPPAFAARFAAFLACFSLMESFGLLFLSREICPLAMGSLLVSPRRALRRKSLTRSGPHVPRPVRGLSTSKGVDRRGQHVRVHDQGNLRGRRIGG